MKKIAFRGAAVAAAAGMALSGAAVGTANADTVLNLGTISTSQKVGDANVVVTLKNQKVVLSPGMVSLPTTRNAWVSGNVSATINGGKAKGGSISAGYVVGCQIDVGAANLSFGAGAESGAGFNSASTNANGPLSVTPSVSAKSGGSIKLAAGALGTQYLTYDNAKWPEPGTEVSSSWASPSTSFKFEGKSGSLSYEDQTIGVDGCAGYAQAKFFARVSVSEGNTSGTVILWGKPFTLG